MSARDAARLGLGGWISPKGDFYAAPYLHHIRVASELRATGDGPNEPWEMNDGWVMVKSHGEVLALPTRVTQAQLDMLADILQAAVPGVYRSQMITGLRVLAGMIRC